MKFSPLKIAQVVSLTDQAKAIYFETAGNATYQFSSGQYVTLKLNLNGEELRRDYSIFTSPEDGNIGIGIKRVEGGKVSNFINDNFEAGQTIEVSEPQGRFCLPQEESEEYVFMACGSGITPILSMVKSALKKSGTKKVQLLFANKSKEDTMFFDEIIELAGAHQSLLNVTFFYSRNYSETEASDNVSFREGRLHENFVQSMIEGGVFHRKAEYFICGPEDLTVRMQKFLKRSMVAENHIHFELFTALKVEAATNTSTEAEVKVEMFGDEYAFKMDKGHYILEEGLSKDVDMPFSCQGGVCTSCMCKVKSGEVDMQENFTLTDQEMDEGYILTCISKPVSDVVELVFE